MGYLTRLIFGPSIYEEAHSKDEKLQDPYYLIKLYSSNPRILRRCAAAFYNIPLDNERIKNLNVTESSLFIEPFRRVLLAFADGLQEEREVNNHKEFNDAPR